MRMIGGSTLKRIIYFLTVVTTMLLVLGVVPAFAVDTNKHGAVVFDNADAFGGECPIISGEEFCNHRVTTPNERGVVEDGGNNVNAVFTSTAPDDSFAHGTIHRHPDQNYPDPLVSGPVFRTPVEEHTPGSPE